MGLSEEQKQAVTSWIEAGEGLSEVQKLIGSEFGISMTYMDVRFLVDDLGASLQDNEVPEPEPKDDQAPDAAAVPDETLPPAGTGSVKLEIDRIKRAGALVSGSVVFSDGMQATWEVDSAGRLALRATQPDYRPSEEDLAEFQQQLSAQFQSSGF